MNKSQIREPLNLSKSALGTSSVIPSVDCFYFEGKRTVAYNGSLAIIATLENDFPVKGFIVGQPLVKLLQELPDEIELSNGDGNLVIKAGNSKAKFPVTALNGCLFTEPSKSPQDQQLPISSMFGAGIKKCMISLEGKSAEQKEVGISLFIEDGNCELYSTNGMTLSKYQFQLDEKENKRNISTFLPASFCEQFCFLSAEQLTHPDEVAISKEYIRAIFPKMSLYCSFYATEAKKNIRDIFNSSFNGLNMIGIPKGFDDSLRRCEVIAGDSTIVELEYDETTLNIYAKGVGEIKEILPITYPTKGKLQIGVKNLRRVIDSCSAIGFGTSYIGLEGADKYFHHIINSKS